MRFRAEQHLRRQSDFRATRDNGRRLDCCAFTLWWPRRPAEAVPAEPTVTSASGLGPRVGVVAAYATVGRAVARNRAKRRLREIFRHHQNRVPADVDLLLVAKAPLNRLEYAEIEQK